MSKQIDSVMRKRPIFRLFLTVAIATTFAAVAFFGISTHKSAHAAGCYGSGCYNLDPFQEGCSISSTNSTTIYQNGTPVGEVDNEYSTACNANWVEGTLYGGRTGLQIWIFTKYGPFEETCYPDNCSSTYYGTAFPAWSNMIDGTNVTTACGKYRGGQAYCVDQ